MSHAQSKIPTPVQQAPQTKQSAQTRRSAARRRPPARGERRRGGEPGGDELAIRWFTPKGRAAVVELLEELRFCEGQDLHEVVGDLRRSGVAPEALDLRGIDLRGKDLANANLPQADLRGARLEGANLAQANLSGARLDRAAMRGVKLTNANLAGASLSRTDLRDADLADANLEGALIDAAKLKGASLRRAWVKGIDFERAFAEGADIDQVRREEYRPPVTRRMRKADLGAPPGSEPTRATQRFRTTRNVPRPTGRFGAMIPRRAPVQSATGFDEALAQLLLQRGQVGRITALIDGQEVVIFDAGSQGIRRVA